MSALSDLAKQPDFLAANPEKKMVMLQQADPERFGRLPESQQRSFVARQWPTGPGGFPIVPPGTPVQNVLSPSQYIAQGIQRRLPDIGMGIGALAADVMTSGAAVPATAPAILRALGGPVARRVAGSALGGMAGQTAKTGTEGRLPTGGELGGAAAMGAGSQVAGEAVGAGLVGVGRILASPRMYQALSGGRAEQVLGSLLEKVPGWKGLPGKDAGEKLWEAAHGVGQSQLSEAYEAVLQNVKRQIPAGAQVEVPTSALKDLGIKTARTPKAARPEEADPAVEVAIPKVIDGLKTLRKSNVDLYHDVLDRTTQALSQHNLGEMFTQAREAYTWGSGWREFAKRSGALKDKTFDLVAAQRGLDKASEALFRRNMEPVARTINPVGEPRITKGEANIGHGLGAGVGYAVGHQVGHPYIGASLGAGAGGLMIPKVPIYRNVPGLDAIAEQAKRFGSVGIAGAGREAKRQLEPNE